jgi:hypothetical protein
MNDFRSPLRTIALFAVALVTLAIAGCTKKINTVDPNYISPEGRTAADAQQIVFPDLPANVSYWKKPPPSCEECPDTLVSVTPVYPTGPGVINGMILDGTAASGYQILRRESNGGYAPLYDYVLNPAQRFAQSGWKRFAWLDGRPSGFAPPSYVGRGIVSGVITPTAPLTNVASLQAVELHDIVLTTDSLRSFTYTPVPGAVAYIMQVYSVPNGYVDAAIHNAAPAPYASEDHRDYLVHWAPATNGEIDNSKVQVLAQLRFVPGAFYLAHMSAVDAQGRLIGFSYGDPAVASGPQEGYYRLFRAGAIQATAAHVTSINPAPVRALFRARPAPQRPREISLSQVKIRFGGR